MDLKDFTGGLFDPEGVNFAIPPNGLLTADNLEFLRSGGIRGRRGFTSYITSATAGLTNPIILLWRHYANGTAANSFLAARDNSTTVSLLRDGTGTGGFSTTLITSWTTAQRVYPAFWPQRNSTFLVNGSNGLYRYDGTNLNTVTNAAVNVNGPFITVWKSRLWTSLSTELDRSIYGSNVNDETNFPAGNQLNVSDPQGGNISGLVGFSDALIILKETNLWRFIGDIQFGGQLTRYSDQGCIANQSPALTPYGVIYLARDGVRLTDGLDPEGVELSAPIRPLFVSRSSQAVYTTAVGKWHARKNAYYINLLPSATVGYVCTALHTVQGTLQFAWTRHDSLFMNAAASWDSEADAGQLYTGDNNGMVWEYDTGTTDNATAITTRLQTVSVPFSSDLKVGRAAYVRALVRSEGTLSVGQRYDNATANDTSITLGTTGAIRVQDVRGVVSNQSNHGQFLSLYLTASGSYDFELHVLSTEDSIKPSSRRVWRHD